MDPDAYRDDAVKPPIIFERSALRGHFCTLNALGSTMNGTERRFLGFAVLNKERSATTHSCEILYLRVVGTLFRATVRSRSQSSSVDEQRRSFCLHACLTCNKVSHAILVSRAGSPYPKLRNPEPAILKWLVLRACDHRFLGKPAYSS
jgi:hypothetical protein